MLTLKMSGYCHGNTPCAMIWAEKRELLAQRRVAGLDYLSYPTGVIQEAQDLAAEAFGAEQTWFLVNGTTAGMAHHTLVGVHACWQGGFDEHAIALWYYNLALYSVAILVTIPRTASPPPLRG